MFHRHYITAALIGYLILTAGCYSWRVGERVDKAEITKIETPLAQQFCSALLNQFMQEGCAVRIVNTTTNESRCVMVVLPGHELAVRHEASHCMGQDH